MMAGWFTKRSGYFIKEWKRRWIEFSLDEAVIRYYSTKEDPEPVGIINIRGSTVEIIGEKDDCPPFCFLVVTAAPETKEHFIAASDTKEMQDWIDALYHYMSEAEGRKSLSEIDGLSSEEAKVLQELCRIKEGIMSLKEACVEAKGDKEQIPAELIDMGLKGQAAITKWVQNPSMNDALLNELLHWNDEVNAVVSDFNLG